MKILVTGAAGFIGFHVCKFLCERGDEVVGIDNLNEYYDVSLKEARLAQLTPLSSFRFRKMDIADRESVAKLFEFGGFRRVVHLAAQAGVRYSIENPSAYADSNLVGFLNILEGCRHSKVEHLVYASSSSVYGANEKFPFSETDNVDHPVSLYAATKKANEAMAHSYSHLYGLATTGLRFFTVYGPWGRPDMSPILFADAITEGKPLKVFNYGKHRRDFTYIDDIVEGVVRTLDRVALSNLEWSGMDPDPSSSKAPWRIYNIGNSEPVELLDYITCLEGALKSKAKKVLLPIQMGDIEATYADVSLLNRDVSYKPHTSLESGIHSFAKWYIDYYLSS
ncbi:NAD-dependent epimerase [Pseudomonadales bacterium]|nr:NAD-dependent epimerase [Pseudomonadales bacterium]